MRASKAHAFFITVSVLMEPSTDSDHIIDFWLCVLNHSIRSISDARNGAFIWAFATSPLYSRSHNPLRSRAYGCILSLGSVSNRQGLRCLQKGRESRTPYRETPHCSHPDLPQEPPCMAKARP